MDTTKNIINPYNFIPLEEEPTRQVDNRENIKDTISGIIDYTLKNISPLFIPNTVYDRALGVKGVNDKDENYHKSYDFFSYSDEVDKDKYYEPVIPASEIRGAIRSIYEVQTNSCLSVVDKEVSLSKRVAQRMKPGILEKRDGELYLYSDVEDYLVRINDRKDFSVKSYRLINNLDGSEVKFTDVTKEKAPNRKGFCKKLAEISDTGLLEGYLVKGNDGPKLSKPRKGEKCEECPKVTKNKCKENQYEDCYLLEKHCAHIFAIKKGNPVEVPVEVNDLYNRMDKLLSIYEKNKDDKEIGYAEYTSSWEKFKNFNESKIPVYYSNIGGLWYFSPASMSREIYSRSLEEMLGKYNSCCVEKDKPKKEEEELEPKKKKEELEIKGMTKICSACRLFGTSAKGIERGSRIRFSDLEVVDKKNNSRDYYDEPITFYDLLSPRLTATELYLQKPISKKGDVLNWTYDYYCYKDGENQVFIEKETTPKMMGRKFYWHNRETAKILKNDQKIIERKRTNMTVRPLKEGITFAGKIYFEHITEEELGTLLSIMNMSSYSQKKLGAKIGAGKPLGFGSVELKVKKYDVRKYENSKYIWDSKTSDSLPAIQLIDDLVKALTVDVIDEKANVITYPSANGKGYEWFVDNRKAYQFDNYKDVQKDKMPVINIKNINNNPYDKRSIVYQKYLEPMKPEFSTNSISKVNMRSSETGKKIKWSGLESCKKYNFITTGYKEPKKGKPIYVKASFNDVHISFNYGLLGGYKDASEVEKNKEVSLIFNKLNDQGFPEWEKCK